MFYQKINWLGFNDEVEEGARRKILIITIVFFAFFLLLGIIGQAVAQPKIEGSNVRYTAGGVEMIGYLAYDQNIQGPATGRLGRP